MSGSGCATCGWNPCVCGTVCQACGCSPCGCSTCAMCGCDPCGCGQQIRGCDRVNPHPTACTVCDGDKECNIWYTPGPLPGIGDCKLDRMTYDQVCEVLSRVPGAKEALLRITSDECLRRLAHSVKLRVSPKEDNRLAQKRLLANSLPFYTVFRGDMNGTKC